MIRVPTHRVPTHPGEMFREEFLEPLGVTQVAFAKHIGVPIQRDNEIVKGRRGISAETAWLFSAALDTTPECWLNLQAALDLALNRSKRRVSALR